MRSAARVSGAVQVSADFNIDMAFSSMRSASANERSNGAIAGRWPLSRLLIIPLLCNNLFPIWKQRGGCMDRIEELHVFVTVADLLSFAQAARRLGISPAQA